MSFLHLYVTTNITNIDIIVINIITNPGIVSLLEPILDKLLLHDNGYTCIYILPTPRSSESTLINC